MMALDRMSEGARARPFLLTRFGEFQCMEILWCKVDEGRGWLKFNGDLLIVFSHLPFLSSP